MSTRVKELERQIAELEARWPAHSVRPAMLEELEELEEKLKKAREEAEKPSTPSVDPTGCTQQSPATDQS